MSHYLFANVFALVNLNTSGLRDGAVALCLLTFLLGYILWFIRYVRIDKPESSEWEG